MKLLAILAILATLALAPAWGAVNGTVGGGGGMRYEAVSNLFSGMAAGGLMQTNRVWVIGNGSTTYMLDFSQPQDWYDVANALAGTNLVLCPTNLVPGRELWVFFSATNNYTVTVSNLAGTAIHWALNCTTNGTTSFTVTNGLKAELALLCRASNVIHAVYGHVR